MNTVAIAVYCCSQPIHNEPLLTSKQLNSAEAHNFFLLECCLAPSNCSFLLTLHDFNWLLANIAPSYAMHLCKGYTQYSKPKPAQEYSTHYYSIIAQLPCWGNSLGCCVAIPTTESQKVSALILLSLSLLFHLHTLKLKVSSFTLKVCLPKWMYSSYTTVRPKCEWIIHRRRTVALTSYTGKLQTVQSSHSS